MLATTSKSMKRIKINDSTDSTLYDTFFRSFVCLGLSVCHKLKIHAPYCVPRMSLWKVAYTCGVHWPIVLGGIFWPPGKERFQPSASRKMPTIACITHNRLINIWTCQTLAEPEAGKEKAWREMGVSRPGSQRGPGAEPLVMALSGRNPLKLRAFWQ